MTPTYQRLPDSQSDSSPSLYVINIHDLPAIVWLIKASCFSHVERRKPRSADVYAQRHDVIHKIHVL